MPAKDGASRRITAKQVKRFKQEAKALKKERGCTHAESLNLVAQSKGYPNWKAIAGLEKDTSRVDEAVPEPSLRFASDEDVQLDTEDAELLQSERTDDLSEEAKLHVGRNRAFLGSKGVEYAIFEPTKTGLKKSILDATRVVRTYFELEGFHDYGGQGQGADCKVTKEAFFVSPGGVQTSRMSLYRPVTKKGDPRMWFAGLGEFADAGDQIAIVILRGCAHLLNLSRSSLAESYAQPDEVGAFLQEYITHDNEASVELLARLRELAKTPLRALGEGDTAVGMAIEHALGVVPNSSKAPDYKGIEIKSGRGTRNRATVFAQVANWEKSVCSSSREILERYGYERGEDFKLYCTVSAAKPNSQGLYFKYEESSDELVEVHVDDGNVAVWDGDVLRSRLKEKHAETFWIKAESEMIEGVEHFILKSVVHTKSPLLAQLMPLIQSGVITMDHLIKRSGGNKPKVSEKGPLFKMNKRDLALLFPAPIKHALREA